MNTTGPAQASSTAQESPADVRLRFARHVRDPQNAPLPPGVDRRRMEIYAQAYRFKLARALNLEMPALAGALGEDDLTALIDDYARLPRVSLSGTATLSEAFVRFLEETATERGLPPWTLELAHFCSMGGVVPGSDREITDDAADRGGDLLAGVPVFSPLARLRTFEWPVHRIGADFRPEAKPPQPTRLILYRNRRHEGGYVELNAMAAEIAERVRDNAAGRTGAEILAEVAGNHPGTEPRALLRDGLGILEALRERDIVLGVRRTGVRSHRRGESGRLQDVG